MIITVTLNAAIDRSLVVPNIRLGHRHHTVDQVTLPGGKGVNVARALKTLGHPVIATGFAGGGAGTRIVEQLTRESILNDFVRITEESRTNTAIFDPTTGLQTEINERGPLISEQELELFQDKLLYLSRGADTIVIAGSLPLNVPETFYSDLIKEVHKLGARVYFDADGERLRHAIKSAPDVVTPNQLEAEEVVGHEFADDSDRINAISELLDHGVGEAVMTLEDGCVAGIKQAGGEPPRLYRAYLKPIDSFASIGSGDAFLAGLVAARFEGRSDEDSLRLAVACGADATQRLGAGVLDPRQIDRLQHEIQIEQLVLDTE